MSATIWYGEGDEDDISLGDPGLMWKSFAEVARMLGDRPGFDELHSVPGFAEHTVTPYWLSQVREQAQRCLDEHGEALSPYTSCLLRSLLKQMPASSR